MLVIVLRVQSTPPIVHSTPWNPSTPQRVHSTPWTPRSLRFSWRVTTPSTTCVQQIVQGAFLVIVKDVDIVLGAFPVVVKVVDSARCVPSGS